MQNEKVLTVEELHEIGQDVYIDLDYYVNASDAEKKELVRITYHVPDLPGEIWVKCESAKKEIAVSNFSRVKRLCGRFWHPQSGWRFYGEKLLTPSLVGKEGNQYFAVNHRGKTYHLHKLLCEAFIPNDDPDHKTIAMHLDGDATNNALSNLGWGTQKENINHPVCKAKMSKVHSKPVECGGIVYPSLKACAEYFQIDYPKMNNWINNRTKMPQQFADMGLKYIEKKNEVK